MAAQQTPSAFFKGLRLVSLDGCGLEKMEAQDAAPLYQERWTIESTFAEQRRHSPRAVPEVVAQSG